MLATKKIKISRISQSTNADVLIKFELNLNKNRVHWYRSGWSPPDCLDYGPAGGAAWLLWSSQARPHTVAPRTRPHCWCSPPHPAAGQKSAAKVFISEPLSISTIKDRKDRVCVLYLQSCVRCQASRWWKLVLLFICKKNNIQHQQRPLNCTYRMVTHYDYF